jgi:hypothetical protein
MTTSDKERLLCYAAGILGSTIANPLHDSGVPDWLLRRSIQQASKLIEYVFDDTKLSEILNEKAPK